MTSPDTASSSTHFGYQTVPEQEKARRVAAVFHSVAARYDLMNDLMSVGMHRLWKAFTVGQAAIRPGMRVLDVAGGTADLARAFAKRARGTGRDGRAGEVWLSDINASMLGVGRDRMIDDGLLMPAVQCDAEKLPFPDEYFDVVSVAFGLRNMTHKDVALAEMRRVLRPGGKLLVLEFSKLVPGLAPLEKLYDAYSFKLLPWLGAKVTDDAESYRYLAESIRMHPDQATLKSMMEGVGFDRVEVYNLSGGVVALHKGWKY